MRISRLGKVKDSVSGSDAIDLSLTDPLFEKFRGRAGSLIPLLQGIQSVHGYIPAALFRKLSEETGMSESTIYGVASFYAQFRLRPAGRYIIRVCHGTACHVQDSDSITEAVRELLQVRDGETSADGLFTLESVACLGCCSLAPVMTIGDKTYGKLTARGAAKIIRDIRRSESN